MILHFSSEHVHADAHPTRSPFSHLQTYTSYIRHTQTVFSFHPFIKHSHPHWWQRAGGLGPYICTVQMNLNNDSSDNTIKKKDNDDGNNENNNNNND